MILRLARGSRSTRFAGLHRAAGVRSAQAAHRSTCDEDEGAGAKQAKRLLIPCAKDAAHGPCCFCCQRNHKAHLQERRL